MQVTIKNNQIHIVMDIHEPVESKSGKTMLVASTGGFVGTGVSVNGKPVSISLNACVRK